MVYNLVIKTLAEQDILEAAEWYNQHSAHLVPEFLTEIDHTINLLKQHPEHFQKRYHDIRVVFFKRFPFSLYYTIESDTIFVHAVLHTRRDPNAGIERT